MDAEERMALRGEHGISIADNASRSGERVGAGIDEEVASPVIERSDLCDEYAGRCGERVGTGIYAEASGPAFEPSVRHWIGELSDAASYEAASSPAVEPSVRSWVGLSAFGPSAEGWIGEVQEKMRSALAASPSLSSISHFRRSPEICKFVLDEAFCRPRVVAIGPYHRHESTSVTDADKWLIVCLMNCLYGIDLAGSLVKMKNQAAAALACYSFADLCESFDVEDDKGFAEVLLLDSYFILFMLTSSESVLMSREIRSRLMLIESDHSTENPPSPLVMPRVNEVVLHRDNIMLDLLILDNQIPFFVVEELFAELKLGEAPPRLCPRVLRDNPSEAEPRSS
ncbi:hypothetical protein ACMD2_26881 [Ananas comosus]|uniref:Uncharacterized protein n=1 Tax=Ananas comosus TaxID=4615 RepID=A0A199V101_ANACO|nr:hypothetical protein ACMD2_26881 [Ananas comosus]